MKYFFLDILYFVDYWNLAHQMKQKVISKVDRFYYLSLVPVMYWCKMVRIIDLFSCENSSSAAHRMLLQGRLWSAMFVLVTHPWFRFSNNIDLVLCLIIGCKYVSLTLHLFVKCNADFWEKSTTLFIGIVNFWIDAINHYYPKVDWLVLHNIANIMLLPIARMYELFSVNTIHPQIS